jgi:hypothetical protein
MKEGRGRVSEQWPGQTPSAPEFGEEIEAVPAVSVGTAPPGGNIEPLTHVAATSPAAVRPSTSPTLSAQAYRKHHLPGPVRLAYSLEDVFTNNVVDTEWSRAELGY